uniref:Uncharacterized protein n=1 Tax=Rhizophora mucronata TaxID=61149 RepID=A0A2P2N473_RHIMU
MGNPVISCSCHIISWLLPINEWGRLIAWWLALLILFVFDNLASDIHVGRKEGQQDGKPNWWS